MISEKELLEFGFHKQKDDFPIWPFEKHLSEPDEDGNRVMLVVTIERNEPEFALVMPTGDKLFLQVESLDQLRTFESAIQSFDPNY